MKANELMIGDWVNLTYRSYISGEVVSKDFRVAQIRKYTTQDTGYHLYAERQNMGDVENISPILLTPEILEKNGFEKLNNYQWKYRDNSCKIVVTIAPEIEIDGESLGTSPVNIMLDGALFDVNITFDGFVHEFQRVLRCVGLFELANNFKI